MADKENFKQFVKKNPQLIKYVKNGDMTWQKFYEIFDLYGEEPSAWTEYLTEKKVTQVAAATAGFGLGDLFNMLKNLDLDSIQNGVNSIQRVLGVVQDFSSNKDKKSTKEEYKPRPIYKHFED